MSEENTFWTKLANVQYRDNVVLKEKEMSYGDSWKKRGGVGAFMMLARKWDRIELQCSELKYDIFQCELNTKDGLLDDIQDLRRYLTLVETEIEMRSTFVKRFNRQQEIAEQFEKVREDAMAGADPTSKGYVNQDQGTADFLKRYPFAKIAGN
jgi:hypothetical protein